MVFLYVLHVAGFASRGIHHMDSSWVYFNYHIDALTEEM